MPRNLLKSIRLKARKNKRNSRFFCRISKTECQAHDCINCHSLIINIIISDRCLFMSINYVPILHSMSTEIVRHKESLDLCDFSRVSAHDELKYWAVNTSQRTHFFWYMSLRMLSEFISLCILLAWALKIGIGILKCP